MLRKTIDREMHPVGEFNDRQKKRSLDLTDADVDRAKIIGDGNISRGIRRALRAYSRHDIENPG